MKGILAKPIFQYAIALVAVGIGLAILEPFHSLVSTATVALTLLVIILLTATFIGRNPALLSSLLAALGLNFFFMPPIRTLTISDPQNWIAWAVFSITAVTAGELSAYARRRASEAEKSRQELQKMYSALQEAFEKASHAEALRQSEQLKSALLDAVTHDMRTPLTSIKAAITSLLDENSDDFELDAEGRKELLEIINEESDRLNHFIDGMIELARLEVNEVGRRRSWSSIEEILSAAIERASPLIRDHRVLRTVAPDLPSVRVDAKALAEVVYSLLDNAAKYSPKGSTITINSGLAADSEPDGMLCVSVEDEGKGIPEGLREKVFDKFFRASLEPQSRVQLNGLGLGLAIARGIVAAHGGRIWIEAGAGGKGTRVSFTVPIGEDEA